MKKMALFLALFGAFTYSTNAQISDFSSRFLASRGSCSLNANTAGFGYLNDNKCADLKINFIDPDGNKWSCSGTLINQKDNNGKPRQLVYLAHHCLIYNNTARGVHVNTNNAEFIFNYQTKNDNDLDVPGTVAGSTFITYGNRGVSDLNNTGAPVYRYLHKSPFTIIDYDRWGDAALIEITKPIPPHYNVYYSGFSTSDVFDCPVLNLALSAPFTVFHHPLGDIKKVATSYLLTNTNTTLYYGCVVVTRFIDWVGSWFGGHWNTETICNYTTVPWYALSFGAIGIGHGGLTEGSSGSGLLNRDGNLIGCYSGGAIECGPLPGINTFGSFKAFFTHGPVKDALYRNYDSNIFTSTFNPSVSGFKTTCHDDLTDLYGQYYPLKDYQMDNHLTISTNNTPIITHSGKDPTIPELTALRIYPGADFTFSAPSNQRIELNPGFSVESGATFKAVLEGCGTSQRLAASDTVLDISNYLPNNANIAPDKVNEKKHLEVFPNPSNGFFSVKFHNQFKGMCKFSLLDLSGREVKVLLNAIINDGENLIRFEAPELTNGLYLVRIEGIGINESARLLIKTGN